MTKIISAEEARKIEDKGIQKELEFFMYKVQIAAEDGFRDVHFNFEHKENIDKIKSLGYKKVSFINFWKW